MRSDLQRALDTHSALKIISGLTNYDPQRVVAVVKAADQGGATLVDIAADADLVRLAKAATTLPICVSAVKPEAFLAPVAAGADLIQTEGGTSSHPTHPGPLGLIEKAAPTLAAAHAISRAVQVPVLCASGLSDVTAPLAIAAGAAGVGVGSAVNKLDNALAMVAVVRQLVESLQAVRIAAVR